MDCLVKKKIGIIGISEGNGHPYSFSSIINGYNPEVLKKSGWDGIYKYMTAKDETEVGFEHIEITHIWTQSREESDQIAKVANIPHIVNNMEDMITEVDAVIIARDDYENHFKYAYPFLEKGLKVLIDKPLTLDREEYIYFKKYILSGQLMSLSGMRYATELDTLRTEIKELGKVKYIHTVGISQWERYAIHLIDAVLPMFEGEIQSVEYLQDSEHLFHVKLNDDIDWIHYNNSMIAPTFRIDIFSEEKNMHIQIKDNFTMFKRMLKRFEQLVAFNKTPKDQGLTLKSIQLLIMMNESKCNKRKLNGGDFRV